MLLGEIVAIQISPGLTFGFVPILVRINSVLHIRILFDSQTGSHCLLRFLISRPRHDLGAVLMIEGQVFRWRYSKIVLRCLCVVYPAGTLSAPRIVFFARWLA